MKKFLAGLMLVAFVTVTGAAYAGTAVQTGGDKKEDKDKDKDKKGGKKGHKGGKKGKKSSGGTTTPAPK